MAHYAILDENNIVIDVFVGKDENEEGINWEQKYSEFQGKRCLRTSYNTSKGVHLTGGTPFRKNYAGKGYSYNDLRDAFIPPKPFPSWTLNEETCTWQAPVSKPEDAGTGTPPNVIIYHWDEITLSWVRI